MRPLPLLLLSLSILGPPSAFARQDQDPFAPAPELRALAPMVGTWTGSGTAKMGPDDPGMAWTATTRAEWILDGHALREVTRVDFGEAVPGGIAMLSLTAFERESGRLVQYNASSMGGLFVADLVAVPQPGVVVSAKSGRMDGQATVDRSITRIQGSAMTLSMERAIDGGPTFVHVQGSFQKSADAGASVDASAPRADGLDASLAALRPMLGTWDVSGTWCEAPGAEMKVTGVDTIVPILGGHALEIATTGTAEDSPFQYQAIGLTGWNAAEGTYHQAWVDNMGVCGHADLRDVGGGRFVSVRAGVQDGVPYADRSVLVCKDGLLSAATSDRFGEGPPLRMFDATYVKRR